MDQELVALMNTGGGFVIAIKRPPVFIIYRGTFLIKGYWVLFARG